MSRLILVDPLTLVGRELLELLPESRVGHDLSCVHTSLDDEHQIGEIGGEAMLIPPLEGSDDLRDCSILAVCSDDPGQRFRHVHQALDAHPHIAVLDIGRVKALASMTAPIASPPLTGGGPYRIRLAHPALCAAATILQPLQFLRPRRLALAAFDPASSNGMKAFETMARQAASRLQGESVHDLIGGEVLAFNLIARDPSDLLDEAASVLSGLSTTATLVHSGCFHGHFATLAVTLDETVDESVLREAWSTEPDLVVGELPARLDSVVGSDQITLGPPVISAEGNGFTVTAMLDGLRIGGAVTAIRLLEALHSGS